jgi:hypothetical protein
MRHRVLMGAIAASFVLAGSLAAQELPKEQQTHFGFMAGATLARLHGSDVTGTISNRVGLAGGVFATVGLIKNLALEPQVIFAMKGAKESEGTASFTVKTNYIDIPLLIKARFPSTSGNVSPHFYVGPQVGFRMSCKFSGTDGTTASSGDCKDPPFSFSTKQEDFNLVLGAGLDIGRALVDIRYDWGVSRIQAPTVSDALDIKNRALFILVGWTMRPVK